ncbi:helix-turn-helix transcriptional regulator [Dolosigranulum pigrum]|uniref:helix-turn-helix transcriptional regulator n=1 Tax=Dolosigranulum pigrum TaxID=29394 RepID=UPI003137D4EA
MNPNKLKEIRRKNSVTQNMLANLLNVSQQTISCWENGGLFQNRITCKKWRIIFKFLRKKFFTPYITKKISF